MYWRNIISLYCILSSAAKKTFVKQAVTKNFTLSQYSLAKLYATGLGIKKDEVRALALFLEAGEAGFVKAQYNLGKLYRDGIGTDADPIAAAGWFMRAAVQGYAKAQEKLIRRFTDGTGVDRDMAEALKWATLATRQGRASAQAILDDMRTSMSRQQIDEAELRAKAFQPVSISR
jgi:TPR repeat protein